MSEAKDIFQKISTRFINDKYMARYNPKEGAVLADGRNVGSWEYWPRGETVSGGYLSREAERPPGFVYYERQDMRGVQADSYATMFIFNACGKDEPDLHPRRGLGEFGSKIDRSDTVDIPLMASIDKSAAAEEGTRAKDGNGWGRVLACSCGQIS